MTWSDKIESSVACRAHAERLRTLAKAVTTPGLRKTLMDGAADYDKLARQMERLSDIGTSRQPNAPPQPQPVPSPGDAR